MPAPLPIDAALPQLVASLRQHPATVLRAPTGAGKTTRVPPALLDAGLAGAGQVVILEPRRLAARAAARRMSVERGTPLACPPDDALHGVAVLEAIVKSAQSGRREPIG